MQKSRRTRGIQTRLIHSPQTANDTTAVSPPIFQTSTFLMPTPEEGVELAEQVAPAMFYTRYGSPNTKQVEVLLAELEGSEAALAAVLEQVQLPGVQRVLVPTVQFVLLYLLKVLFGGQSMNELPRWLCSNVALMELVGFNAQQVEAGLTKRGDAQRKGKQKQGPLSP